MADTRTVALCGKGGVGKTSISALMIKLLAENQRGLKVLAVDADPAAGLSAALGVTVNKTVDDIRKQLISRIAAGESRNNEETIRLIDYEVFDAVVEQDGFSLLAIGRPEDEGCFCKVNSLLKDIINDLAGNLDIVLIDGEAGVEQINRRVMKTVDNLVLVSDTSAKGITVANTLAHVARDNKAVGYQDMGLILNRIKDRAEVDDIAARTELALYGWICEDELIRAYDFQGKPFTLFPDTSATLDVISQIMRRMGFY